MYDAFERDRKLLGPGQFCEVRYEELVADPLGQMRRVYEELGTGRFRAVRPGIEDYLASQKDYKTNRYQMTPELRERNHPPLGQVYRAVRLFAGLCRCRHSHRTPSGAGRLAARPDAPSYDRSFSMRVTFPVPGCGTVRILVSRGAVATQTAAKGTVPFR